MLNAAPLVPRYLYGFEEYCRSTSITFRTIHHNNPRPPPAAAVAVATSQKQLGGQEPKGPAMPPLKAEASDEKMEAESENESEKEELKERHSSPRVRRLPPSHVETDPHGATLFEVSAPIR